MSSPRTASAAADLSWAIFHGSLREHIAIFVGSLRALLIPWVICPSIWLKCIAVSARLASDRKKGAKEGRVWRCGVAAFSILIVPGLDTAVMYVKGVGPRVAEMLAAKGILT